MSSSDTGGPAFPHGPMGDSMTFEDGRTNHQYGAHPGMSLRDWFAGMAMSGMYANRNFDDMPLDEIAHVSYIQADEMLSAKEYEPVDDGDDEWTDECPICKAVDEDMRQCTICDRYVCVGCAKLCCVERDEANRMWCCGECIAKNDELFYEGKNKP